MEGSALKMISWLYSNIATIAVAAVLLTVVALIIIQLVKDKKKGKSSCGGNCGSCPMGGSCHKH